MLKLCHNFIHGSAWDGMLILCLAICTAVAWSLRVPSIHMDTNSHHELLAAAATYWLPGHGLSFQCMCILSWSAICVYHFGNHGKEITLLESKTSALF